MPMELDYVSGSEMHVEEEWDDVDEVRRSTMPQLRNDGTLREGLQDER